MRTYLDIRPKGYQFAGVIFAFLDLCKEQGVLTEKQIVKKQMRLLGFQTCAEFEKAIEESEKYKCVCDVKREDDVKLKAKNEGVVV